MSPTASLYQAQRAEGARLILLHTYKRPRTLTCAAFLAGQAVVAFATCTYDRSEYAIKFFHRASGFAVERAVRSSPALHAILPPAPVVHDPEDDPAGESDRGRGVRVPCIVMPRGESLEEWSRRARPDVFQAAAVRPSSHMRACATTLLCFADQGK